MTSRRASLRYAAAMPLMWRPGHPMPMASLGDILVRCAGDDTDVGAGMLDLMLKAGGNANHRCFRSPVDSGMRLLHEAARCRSGRAVGVLLAHGAEIDARSGDGKTPFLYACSSGWFEAARRFLELRANPAAESDDGMTALVPAVAYRDKPFVDILLQRGVVPNALTIRMAERCWPDMVARLQALADLSVEPSPSLAATQPPSI